MNENLENVLYHAEKMFIENNGMPPVIFMRLKNKMDLFTEFLDLNTKESTLEVNSRFKKMIESGELQQYIFISDIYKGSGEFLLVVIKANITEEIQCVCDVKVEDSQYHFGKWNYYDSTEVLAKKNSFNNLFGQVYSRFN